MGGSTLVPVSLEDERMILRQWSAEMLSAKVPAYREYFARTGAADYGATPGNLGFELVFGRIDGQRSRVMTLSWWESLDAIRAFAGEDYGRARYYPGDAAFFLTMPERVEHFEVAIARAAEAR
jgi:heme-degrading monooxygenase HmoA